MRPYLTDEEEPVEILAREVKEFWNKKIPLVKVLWRNHKTEEACDIPNPGGPVDHRQPAETCESHIMRLIRE